MDLILIFFSEMSSIPTQALVCPDVEYVGNDHAFLQPLVVTIFFSGPVPQHLVREQIVSFLLIYMLFRVHLHISATHQDFCLCSRGVQRIYGTSCARKRLECISF